MMDSAREADKAIVSPRLLESLRSDDLVNYSLWNLGVDGFTATQHHENLELPPESDDLLLLLSDDYELGVSAAVSLYEKELQDSDIDDILLAVSESRESCEEQSRDSEC